MTLVTEIVDTAHADPLVVPFDVSTLWSASFPSADLVGAAAGLLTPLRPADRPYVRGDRSRTVAEAGRRWETTEGPRSRIVVGPGSVQIARVDPARAERASERRRRNATADAKALASDMLLEHNIEQADAAIEAVGLVAASGLVPWSSLDGPAAHADWLAGRLARRDDPAPASVKITAWSRKSRANMVKVLAQLDYSALFGPGMGLPAMATLTYPGDWLTVAPSPAACKAHVDALKKRFQRAYGRPLLGVWKREFQHRGAPHYHILMVPPREQVDGLGFAKWLGRTWAEIVDHPDPVERMNHERAGTGIDYAEGTRARDPKRLAVYFSKHGAYGAKEYQNQAPQEWAETGSVGRFWGVWGLDRATATVEVSEVEARAAARTLRRWQEANGYRVQTTVNRRRFNTRTGEIRHAARCGRGSCEGYCFVRKTGSWSGARMRGLAGFVVCNDGAAMVSALARHLDAVREAAQADEIAAWQASPVRLRAIDRAGDLPVSALPAAPQTEESPVSEWRCEWPPRWRTGGAESVLAVRPLVG